MQANANTANKERRSTMIDCSRIKGFNYQPSWGSLSDEARVANIRFTLGALKTRGIAWLVYLLHHSLIADAHRP